MKIKQLTEAKYAEEKPQFTGLTAEQVVKKFFDLEEEMSEEGDNKHFYAKEGLHVIDNVNGEEVKWLIFMEDRTWISLDHDNDRQLFVNPSKFTVYQQRVLYK